MTGRDESAPVWVDHGIVPPQRLPAQAEEAAAYLAEALGHPVYERWTWTRLAKVYGALPDARRAKPAVCRLLIDAPVAVEAWQRGRLRVLPADQAPDLKAIVQALLATHGKRFRPATAERMPAQDTAALATGALPGTLSAWLQRRGRLANLHADTNTLGAIDDYAAVAAFLRERATRSRHTWRAYVAELQRLALWCQARGQGPLSDLTRQDLLAYRQALGQPGIESGTMDTDQTRAASVLSQRSQARALAVVASLFGHWHDTGYLLGNPAAGLVGGARARAGFAPKRFVPAPLLQACDDWVVRGTPAAAPSAEAEALRRWRQVAVWTVFRCAGVRLSELAWAADAGLPRLDIDEHGGWTLQVLGKGGNERAIRKRPDVAP